MLAHAIAQQQLNSQHTPVENNHTPEAVENGSPSELPVTKSEPNEVPLAEAPSPAGRVENYLKEASS